MMLLLHRCRRLGVRIILASVELGLGPGCSVVIGRSFLFTTLLSAMHPSLPFATVLL